MVGHPWMCGDRDMTVARGGARQERRDEMPHDEIMTALAEIFAHFMECARNADKRSNAHKRFIRWSQALTEAQKIVSGFVLDDLMEDDRK